ncbi:hypothetical protein QEJ31_10795 [Pigmentibacter sp. JX0631]|nr:hypothetical protein [Pigmentibacter sp. JX0631]WGL59007.1 hypothetical protein QEJ31_10795 [Pigmentibacter sp. JX0631]
MPTKRTNKKWVEHIRDLKDKTCWFKESITFEQALYRYSAQVTS